MNVKNMTTIKISYFIKILPFKNYRLISIVFLYKKTDYLSVSNGSNNFLTSISKTFANFHIVPKLNVCL